MLPLRAAFGSQRRQVLPGRHRKAQGATPDVGQQVGRSTREAATLEGVRLQDWGQPSPVLPKLAARIVSGDFVTMHELLPECLAHSGDTGKPASKAQAKKRVQDLNTWLQFSRSSWESWGRREWSVYPNNLIY